MSRETSKIRFLSLSRKYSISDIVKNFIIQCNEHSNHEIFAKFGEIKGYYSRMDISLPVACDCVLEQGSSDYKFEEKVGRKQQSYLIERIIRANRESWQVAEQVEIDMFTEERYPNEIVVVNRGEEKLSFCELNLGEVVVYRPKSKVHYSITGISRSTADEPKSDIPSCRFKKSVISWNFKRKSSDLYPFWDLKIIKTNNIHEKKRQREYECRNFNEDNLSDERSKLENDDNDDDDGDDEFWMVVISGNKQLISKHVDLYNKGQINGLDRITNELIFNSSLIAKYLDESASSIPYSLPPTINYYYPNFFGDITTSIRAHYNMKKIQNADNSIIGGLRRYNNEIKRALIDQYFEKQLRYRQNMQLNVLDLACGHGQDILKYKGKRINRLIGIDISVEEISEARHRLRTYENSLNFSVEYHVGNLLSRSTYSKILKGINFEIISIQLSMHYMLINEETSFEFLKNISDHLKPGGFFIGSTISCDQIYYSMKHNSIKINCNDGSDNCNEFNDDKQITKYVSGNSIYKISFDCNDWEKYFSDSIDLENGIKLFRTEWGIKYDFWLIEHINQYEYVVPWESFCALANKVGLELVQYLNFPNFADFTQNNFPNIRLSNWLNNPKNSGLITQQEKEVFALYCVFAFQKKGGIDIVPEEQLLDSDCQLYKKLSSGFKIKKR
ncbi:RNA guanine-7-methyltransferase Abd1p [Cryptosporidium canis]|uniref:mRNA (guanine-N(7))-methyltransferase n=1 Tax=Cryptosporidium canis TaxID=195482 RepID=A0A9D5DGI1_9CRYT|nr:RNA guanine-7-methyltransferase Abd1p [Cryptosporidium canis]